MAVAAVFRSIILNHPFVDGNKRIAVIAAHWLCYVNDCLILATQRQWLTYPKRIAKHGSGMYTLPKVTGWFRPKMRAMQDLERWAEESGDSEARDYFEKSRHELAQFRRDFGIPPI